MKFFIPVFLLVLTIGVSAQPAPGAGMERGKALIADKLNLTPDQQKSIESLRTANQKQMIDLRAEMAKLHIAKKELLNKGNYDRKTNIALEEKISKQKNVIDAARANHQMDVYQILNADQKEIWNSRPMGQGMGMRGKGLRRNNHCPNGCDGFESPKKGKGFHGRM